MTNYDDPMRLIVWRRLSPFLEGGAARRAICCRVDVRRHCRGSALGLVLLELPARDSRRTFISGNAVRISPDRHCRHLEDVERVS